MTSSTPTDNSLLNSVRSDVNICLADHLDSQLKRAYSLHPDYGKLWEIIKEVSLAGGKRLRPYMVALSYSAFSHKPYKSIVPIAAAVELLHICLLIHDDIIDRDYTRHGQSNVAGQYLQLYKQYIEEQESLYHYSHSAALVAGDLAMASAYQLIAASDLSPAKRVIASQLLSDSVFGVCGGELLDTESSFKNIDEIDPLKIALLKTSSYSFVGPLITGATMADASEKELLHLREFGESLGIAFQLTDDLLGVYGEEAATGKSTTGDLREGKRTFLAIEALTKAGPDRAKLESILGNTDLTEDQAATARLIIEQSGAKQETEDLIHSYSIKAKNSLDHLQLNNPDYQLFMQLIDLATKRSS